MVGHDARQRAAAQTLQAAGFRIIGPEAACQADFVLLPMSQERVSDAVARTLQGVRPGTLLLAGRPGSPIQAAARQASLPLLDYFQRPELECLNAVPTAEGCLALLLQLRRRTIWESDFLVLGYGRIGRAVARRLDLLGGHTTVAARTPCSGPTPGVRGIVPPRWTACPCCWQSMIPSSTPSRAGAAPQNAGKLPRGAGHRPGQPARRHRL